ncbi:hypothetical protein LSTR_LSTR010769 [Laodelphax striatellus]|uniref:Uncharacterized protein n=1 Tax=Laodelphax striatellus TaxID=195883 RepID=A0A482WNW9_LAOST|nr:hypothetical protein LSTR_LSTR010769 [Laodelphax striatellus]
MAVVGVVSRSKVLLTVDLNRVFSLSYFVGTGKCHERVQQHRSSSSSSSSWGGSEGGGGRSGPPLVAAPETSTCPYTISVRSSSSSMRKDGASTTDTLTASLCLVGWDSTNTIWRID